MFEKYAELLLKKCLNIKKGQPLLIAYPAEVIDLVRIITKKALEYGCNDIYYDWYDSTLKSYFLNSLTEEEMQQSSFFNKKVYDDYAKKDGAFLMLYSEESDSSAYINPEKIAKGNYITQTSRPIYREKQGKYEVPWCIAMVATEASAKKVFPDVTNSKEKLWEAIFKACMLDCENPLEKWDEMKAANLKNVTKLNKYHFKSLHYTNSIGTDLMVELPFNHIWCGTDEHMPDGRPLLVNMPSFEVFTSPMRDKTNGIVYASKPLVYNGIVIDRFWIKFKEGRVIDYDAESGREVLGNMINTDDGASLLGEVALVEYDSPISNSNILFYNTLFDENAACHLALGNGFPACYENGINMSKDELLQVGINQSNEHTDFMIGTRDMKIVGTTFEGEEITFFEHGNFSW